MSENFTIRLANVADAEAERLDRLVLHASEAGRPLYERLGFVGTSEMRLASE